MRCLLLLVLVGAAAALTAEEEAAIQAQLGQYYAEPQERELDRNETRGSKQPNFVFLLVDDLGWGDVGYHNNEVLTPNIDKLAKAGLELDQNYGAPVCTPSRGQIMMGKYAYHMGMQHSVIYPASPDCSPLDQPTLGEALKPLGYKTHFLGKWHLGYCKWACTPNERGYDSFYGFYNGYVAHYSHEIHEGYDWRDDKKADLASKGKYSTTILRDRAVKIIKEHNKKKPMYLHLAYAAVHSPIEVPSEFTDKKPYKYPSNIDKTRRDFMGMVSAVDESVGAIVQALKDNKMWDNTVLVFTSDNGGEPGGSSNYPLRGSKITLWEGGVRVPGFVYSELQKKSAQKKKHTGLFHETDWFPTLVRLGGGSKKDIAGLDGIDQSSMIMEGGSSKRTEMVLNIDQYDVPLFGRGAIRAGDWKLIAGYPGLFNGWSDKNGQGLVQTHTDPSLLKREVTERGSYVFDIPAIMKFVGEMEGTYMLFNVKKDPQEKKNLAATETKKLNEMVKKYNDYYSSKVPVNLTAIPELKAGYASNFGGVWSPGWCNW